MSQPIVPLTVPQSRRVEKKGRNDILMKIRLGKVEFTFFQSQQYFGAFSIHFVIGRLRYSHSAKGI
ncbi:TPA: hypothetical protein ACGO9X_001737 [Streptococcus suis]